MRELMARIQGKIVRRKDTINEGEISGCPTRALTPRTQQSFIGVEWIFLNTLDNLIMDD